MDSFPSFADAEENVIMYIFQVLGWVFYITGWSDRADRILQPVWKLYTGHEYNPLFYYDGDEIQNLWIGVFFYLLSAFVFLSCLYLVEADLSIGAWWMVGHILLMFRMSLSGGGDSDGIAAFFGWYNVFAVVAWLLFGTDDYMLYHPAPYHERFAYFDWRKEEEVDLFENDKVNDVRAKVLCQDKNYEDYWKFWKWILSKIPLYEDFYSDISSFTRSFSQEEKEIKHIKEKDIRLDKEPEMQTDTAKYIFKNSHCTVGFVLMEGKMYKSLCLEPQNFKRMFTYYGLWDILKGKSAKVYRYCSNAFIGIDGEKYYTREQYLLLIDGFYPIYTEERFHRTELNEGIRWGMDEKREKEKKQAIMEERQKFEAGYEIVSLVNKEDLS